MNTSYKIKNLEALDDLSKELQAEISKKSLEYKNQIFFLEAQMGSGKTTFTRRLIQRFDNAVKVSSPTFTGMHLYNSKDFDFYHYDLYQVGLNLEELEDILTEEKNKLIFFEWAENLKEDIKKGFQNKDTLVKNIRITVDEASEERVFSFS